MKIAFLGRAVASMKLPLVACGVAACGVFFGAAPRAEAAGLSRGPVISPSIIAAHRLKYYPPRGWIRHYLGDDRYKIGTIWKVVTTPNDKFYYPPFAREMMMARPGNIIGFASAQDAQEAGYAPAPSYNSAFGLDSHQMAIEDARDVESVSAPIKKSRQSGRKTSNSSSVGQRITLSDGVSSVLLPTGWSVISSSITSGVPSAPLLLASPNHKNVVMCGVVISPGLHMENAVTPDYIKKMLDEAKNTSSPGSAAAQLVGDIISYKRSKLGNLKGWAALSKTRTPMPGLSDIFRETVAGKGEKMYMVMQMGDISDPSSNAILNSFRPR